MSKLSVLGILMVFSLFLGCAQNEAMKDDVEKLKEGQANIIKKLEEVEKLVQAKPQPPQPQAFKEAVINIGDDPFKGEALAKVTIAEFTDFQ